MKGGRRLRGTYQRQLKLWCVEVLDAIGQHRPGLWRSFLRLLREQANAREQQTVRQQQFNANGRTLEHTWLIIAVVLSVKSENVEGIRRQRKRGPICLVGIGGKLERFCSALRTSSRLSALLRGQNCEFTFWS